MVDREAINLVLAILGLVIRSNFLLPRELKTGSRTTVWIKQGTSSLPITLNQTSCNLGNHHGWIDMEAMSELFCVLSTKIPIAIPLIVGVHLTPPIACPCQESKRYSRKVATI